MNNLLILCDSRQKNDIYITDYFDKNNIQWIRTGLPSADYMKVIYDNNSGFVKDFSVLIDTKKDVEEIVGNLCRTTEHERIKREVEKAKELGCNNFIFLICDDKIKSIEDLRNWSSKRTKVKGEVLLKIMQTMNERYGIRFIFTDKKSAGAKIVRLLQNS